MEAGIGDTGTLVLGPGQARARYLLDLEMPDDYGRESHKNYNKVVGPHASVAWTDETFAVDGCGGYAQEGSFVTAEIGTGRALAMVTVWGAPFAIRIRCTGAGATNSVVSLCFRSPSSGSADRPIFSFVERMYRLCAAPAPVCRLAAGAALCGDGTALATAQGRIEGTGLDCGPGWCY